ncbi:unnamed protein product [Trichobilharzia szidati]|nr:unnamed protein product [Trichobilharzia szidati]
MRSPGTENSLNVSRLPSESDNSSTSQQRAVLLWKRALKKVKSVDIDPWHNLPWSEYPVHSAFRHRYSAIKKKWVVDEVQIKMESSPFDRGTMRECFRLKKLSQRGSGTEDWQHTSNYVAKRYIAPVDKRVYFDDVRLQMEAKLWGEAFNRHNPPKKVDIFQLSVLELCIDNTVTDDKRNSSPMFLHIERYMEGEYRKYNSNCGFVDECLRNTPQTFSHFTFERSGHRLLVVDIQGVGDLYTDPQIHTSDGVGYNDGNLGARGMALFFHSHRCNPLCKWLGLAEFDLAPSEIGSQGHYCQTNDILNNIESEIDQGEVSIYGQIQKSSFRRRTYSLNTQMFSKSPSQLFGATVVRSSENMSTSAFPKARRRCASASLYDQSKSTGKSVDCGLSSHSIDDELAFDSFCDLKLDEAQCLSHSFELPNDLPPLNASIFGQSYSQQLSKEISVRNRAASGDSGYYGRTNLVQPCSELPDSKSQEATVEYHQDYGNSVRDSVSLLDSPISASPNYSLGMRSFIESRSVVDEPYPFGTNHSILGRSNWVSRRQRNISESSDVDSEECHRVTGNLLYQLMHENHKPSCADHPTNLDQEIGHSILGQIHHELARLHEAGRFIPSNKGGWSHTGLGGLAVNPNEELADQDNLQTDITNGNDDETKCNPPASIDWSAVLFHERHAAQLGCLEAMIVMAHYYLGLPTQLLECPIKPDPSDIRVGIDHLWRAAEGGDRRCMILLARYLDISVSLLNTGHQLNFITTPSDMLLLPALQAFVNSDNYSLLPSISPDSWSEAIGWYKRAVDCAMDSSASGDGCPDKGLDAEGRYDAAEDLLPVYRILARMAEMYSVGGFGLKQNLSLAGDLFSQAGETASSALQGRLAARYFELADEAYLSAEQSTND